MDHTADFDLLASKFRICTSMVDLSTQCPDTDLIQTLYGMNFFGFNPKTGRIAIATDFWIYIATWIPFTLLTFLGYRILEVYHELNDPKGFRRVQASLRLVLWSEERHKLPKYTFRS